MKRKLRALMPYSIIVFLLFLLIRYWDGLMSGAARLVTVSSSLITGMVMAYILNIIMSFYEKRFLLKFRMKKSIIRGLSILLTVISFILFMIIILIIIIPQLQTAINTLAKQIPTIYGNIVAFIEILQKEPYISEYIDEIMPTQSSISKSVAMAVDFITKGGGLSLLDAIKSAMNLTMVTFMGFIFAIYILAGKEGLADKFKLIQHKFLKPKVIERMDYIISVINKSYTNFIIGQFFEAIILGVLCSVGMVIFGFPYAAMVGVVVGVTALIPVFGAYIGGIVGFLMVFTSSAPKALFFLLYLMILQQLENQLIYPRVVGSSIGLPGIWVFAAVVIGGGLFGVVGMMFLIPITAAFYKLFNEYLGCCEITCPSKGVL